MMFCTIGILEKLIKTKNKTEQKKILTKKPGIFRNPTYSQPTNMYYNYVYLNNLSSILFKRLVLLLISVIDPIGRSIANSPRNTKDHLAWTIDNGDPMHEVCIAHKIPRAWQ